MKYVIDAIVTGFVAWALSLVVRLFRTWCRGGGPEFYVFVAKWGRCGEDEGEFSEPYGIAVDSKSKEVYVADTFNHRIQKFKRCVRRPSPK